MKKLLNSIIIIEISLIAVSATFLFSKLPLSLPGKPAFAISIQNTPATLRIQDTQPVHEPAVVVEKTVANNVATIETVPITVQQESPKAVSAAPAQTNGEQTHEKITLPLTETYEISVPSVGIHTSITMNVDGQNMPEYLAALEKGAAHYKGTPHPGEAGSSLLFAHSSFTKPLPNSADAIFRALHFVHIGDTVIVQNKFHKYVYEIYQTRVIVPTDLEFLSQSGPTRVTLMTCTPLGSTAKRLLVYAKQISAE